MTTTNPWRVIDFVDPETYPPENTPIIVLERHGEDVLYGEFVEQPYTENGYGMKYYGEEGKLSKTTDDISLFTGDFWMLAPKVPTNG